MQTPTKAWWWERSMVYITWSSTWCMQSGVTCCLYQYIVVVHVHHQVGNYNGNWQPWTEEGMEIARSVLQSLCNRSKKRRICWDKRVGAHVESDSQERRPRSRPVHDTTGDVGGAVSFSQQVNGGAENSGGIGLRWVIFLLQSSRVFRNSSFDSGPLFFYLSPCRSHPVFIFCLASLQRRAGQDAGRNSMSCHFCLHPVLLFFAASQLVSHVWCWEARLRLSHHSQTNPCPVCVGVRKRTLSGPANKFFLWSPLAACASDPTNS